MNVAWDTRSDRLVGIQRGEAELLRPLCRSEILICPFSDCPDPRLTTRREYTNRYDTIVVDGFRHCGKGADALHAGESVAHLNAKVAVRDWLCANGFTDAEVEHSVRISDPNATRQRRRPDVVANLNGSTPLAFEIQVSALDAASYLERTNDLAAEHFHTTWLWGWPAGDVTRSYTSAFRATPAGTVRWFIDAVSDGPPRLGWAWQQITRGGERIRVDAFETKTSICVAWVPLSETSIDADGHISHPASDAAASHRADVLEDLQRRHEAQAKAAEFEQEAADVADTPCLDAIELEPAQPPTRNLDQYPPRFERPPLAAALERMQMKTDRRDEKLALAARRADRHQEDEIKRNRLERLKERPQRPTLLAAHAPIDEFDPTVISLVRRTVPGDQDIYKPAHVWKHEVVAFVRARSVDGAVSQSEVVAHITAAFRHSPGRAESTIQRFVHDLGTGGHIGTSGRTLLWRGDQSERTEHPAAVQESLDF